MIGVSVIMYTTSYLARDCKLVVCRAAWWHEVPCSLLSHGTHFPKLTRCIPRSIPLLADPAIQKKHEIQKKALHEYYEKHGGAPDHH